MGRKRGNIELPCGYDVCVACAAAVEVHPCRKVNSDCCLIFSNMFVGVIINVLSLLRRISMFLAGLMKS